MAIAPRRRVQVESILATDQAIPAYGGFRLSLEALHQLAEQAVRPGTEMLVNHDRRRPLNASNARAEVRANPRGWNEVVLHFEADASAWEAYEAERKAAGAPGGMSFSITQPLAKAGIGERPAVTIAADAHHFAPDELVAAGAALARLVDVELHELFQFSTEPLAKVAIEYGLDVVRSVPPDLLASALYDLLRGLILKRRSSGGATTIDFTITESPGVRLTTATVTTSSDEVALKAIDGFLALGGGAFHWSDAREAFAPIEQEEPD